jgi:hypothetical protein
MQYVLLYLYNGKLIFKIKWHVSNIKFKIEIIRVNRKYKLNYDANN